MLNLTLAAEYRRIVLIKRICIFYRIYDEPSPVCFELCVGAVVFWSAVELPYKSIAGGSILSVVVECVYCLCWIGEGYRNDRPAKHNFCAFDLNSPRITAHHIHDWIYESLKLPETDVRMIQIDGPRRRVYIKFNNSDRALSVLQETAGRREFRHDTGELSIVHIDFPGMGVRRIRLANLPPEVPDRKTRGVLSPYGEVTEVHEDSWSKAHPYPVYNGIRIAVTKLKNNTYRRTW